MLAYIAKRLVLVFPVILSVALVCFMLVHIAPGDPLVFAAQLLGRAPPPEISFAEAVPVMSPLALSFWQDCRRVRNDKLKRELGVALSYPTYREGLRALLAAP